MSTLGEWNSGCIRGVSAGEGLTIYMYKGFVLQDSGHIRRVATGDGPLYTMGQLYSSYKIKAGFCPFAFLPNTNEGAFSLWASYICFHKNMREPANLSAQCILCRH